MYTSALFVSILAGSAGESSPSLSYTTFYPSLYAAPRIPSYQSRPVLTPSRSPPRPGARQATDLDQRHHPLAMPRYLSIILANLQRLSLW